jgi:hypothetical protein
MKKDIGKKKIEMEEVTKNITPASNTQENETEISDDGNALQRVNQEKHKTCKKLKIGSCVIDSRVIEIASSRHSFRSERNRQVSQLPNSRNCKNITDKCITSSQFKKKIEIINLSGYCSSLADSGVIAIANSPKFANLKELLLSNNKNITDKCIIALSSS